MSEYISGEAIPDGEDCLGMSAIDGAYANCYRYSGVASFQSRIYYLLV